MANEDIKKKCKDLADSLYEFSGEDFSQQHVQMRFTKRLYQILEQMQSMGVLITVPEMRRGHLAGVFTGITFTSFEGNGDPMYIYQHVPFRGTQL